MTSRVLVTGGAGYIGSVVAQQLLAAGHEVVIVDSLVTGHATAIPPGAQFHRAEVAELSGLLGDLGVDAVIHFAARSLVAESVEDPSLYWHNNVVGTLALLDAMRTHDVRHIVFSSSAAVYGETDEMPIKETAPARPTSPYGATKLAIDLALTDFATSYGIGAVSLRYFNVAGALVLPDGTAYGERHVRETHLIPLALRAAQAGEPVPVFGTDYATRDGTCIRDYVHVTDLADAHLRSLAVATGGRHEIVNLGSGRGYSVREVIEAVHAATGLDLRSREAPRRTGDPAVLVASNDRARSLLGWRPQRPLQQMVADAWTFHQRVTGR